MSHAPVTPTATPPEPPLRVRLAVAAGVLLIGLVGAEGLVRAVDGGAFGQLALYEAGPPIGVRLAPGRQEVRAPGGGTSTVTLGAHGLRTPPEPAPGRPWLVLGDSQVLGLGVDDDATLAAHAAGLGLPLVPVAVPGFGVADAVALADALTPALDPAGFVVVVNQANDWDEAGRPVGERFRVAGPWLLPADAAAPWAAFFASPLSRLHLLHHAAVALAGRGTPEPPVWAVDPAATTRATGHIAQAIRGLAERHPLPVVAVYLPLDAATGPERAAASPFAPLLPPGPPPHLAGPLAHALQGAPLAAPLIDLTGSLADPACFLDGDYHLSPLGHARVAAALHRALSAPEVSRR